MATETETVLAAMFTENTGSHLLDSGGAYGRNWERQQGRTAEDFLAAPKVSIDARWDYIDVTIDAFHWLNARVTYAPDMQRKFDLYVALRDEANDAWLVEMEEFAEANRRKYGKQDMDGGCNTYNGENCLSQTLQWEVFTGPNEEQYLALQVHGGCDVRGGYTAPKMFRLSTYEGAYDLYDVNAYTLACDHVEPGEPLPGMPEPDPHALDYRGEWITYGGSFSADPWADAGVEPIHESEDGERFIRCPFCSEPRPMQAYEYPVG